MKTFVVNLRQDAERKKHMRSILNVLNIDAEFIDAINGKDLNDIDHFINKNKTISLKKVGRKLSPGEIGCALSHQLIYKIIIKESIQSTLILEDDIDISPNLIKIMDSKNQFPEQWDIILLGYHNTNSRDNLKLDALSVRALGSNYELININEPAHGTYGYIISLAGAKKILSKSMDFAFPIDHYTGNHELINVYAIVPLLITINKKLSDQSNLRYEREELQKIAHEKRISSIYKILNNQIVLLSGNFSIYGFNELGLYIYKKYSNRVNSIIDKHKAGTIYEHIKIQKSYAMLEKSDVIIITAINEQFIQEIKFSIKKINPSANVISLESCAE